MWGIKCVGDLFLTYGKFTDSRKAVHFGLLEFGDLVEWEVVNVNH